MTTVAEVFAEQLKADGVGHIFGFPGGATVELAEAARRAGLDFVLGHSEWAAGYMAASYAELTRRPGVLLATLGPGATNTVNATAHAFLDRAPLIVMTGAQSTRAERNVHQRLDQAGLFRPITKWSTTASAAVFDHQFKKAIRIAVTERPGPVHIDVPSDQPRAVVTDSLEFRPARVQVAYGVPPALEEVGKRLRAASTPIAIVGHSAVRADACTELLRFAENWGIPVVTTPKAKGVIPESHDLWAGVTDMAGAKYLDAFLARADLILAIGLDGAELIHDWHHRTPTIHLDSVPNLDYVYESDLDLVGDLAACLRELAGMPSSESQAKWDDKTLREHRAGWRKRIVVPGGGLAPSQVVTAAREVLPETSLITCDSGSHKMLVGALWTATSPGSFVVSNGLSTMGFSVPAAAAARMVNEERPVVAFTGDGGFAMVAGELGTLVDRRLPIVIVVFNDGSLDRILQKQLAQGYPEFGTRFGNPDFIKLCEAYGAAGYSAGSVAEFQDSLQQALRCGLPTVIDARIDASEYAAQFSA